MWQWPKGKKNWWISDGKKNRRKQNCAAIMISVDGKRIVFFSEVEIRMGIVWIDIEK